MLDKLLLLLKTIPAEIVITSGLIAAGLVIGLLAEILILSRLNKKAHKNQWKNTETITKAFRGILTLWMVLFTTYLTLTLLKPDEEIKKLLEQLIAVLLIITFILIAKRILVPFVEKKTSRYQLAASSLVTNLVKMGVYGIGIMILLQSLGISITPLLTALGVGGIAVALAFQDTLSNLFSGLYLLLAGKIKVGNYIQLQTGEEGFIDDISWRNVCIKSIYHKLYIIPNIKIASAIVTNYDVPAKPVNFPVDCSVAYDSDLEHVEKVSLQIATLIQKTHSKDAETFEPVLRFREFADSGINFSVILQADSYTEQFPMKHEFIKALHAAFKQENINIPFPVRTVILKREK